MQYMKRLIKYLIPLISAGFLIFTDQITKYLVDTHIPLYDYIPVIDGVFELRYIRNSGTAWGMFAGMNMHTFFIIMTMILIVVMGYAYVKLSSDRRFLPLNVTIVILFAGAIGNMIDRIRYHYVIDFFYFKLIDFPIFNVADIYVVVSMIMLAYFIFFKYKEEDFIFKSNTGSPHKNHREKRKSGNQERRD